MGRMRIAIVRNGKHVNAVKLSDLRFDFQIESPKVQIESPTCQIESQANEIESFYCLNRDLNRIAIWFCPTLIVTPLLKKSGLDIRNPANFRPISYLNNIYKILERLFLNHILPHVTCSTNFNTFQSAYRRNHSTETALLLTLDNVINSVDKGKSTLWSHLT
jgi:hypothetical protein